MFQKLRPLFSRSPPMRVAALMSGTGSNLVNLLENKAHGKSYKIVCIVTDNLQSNAITIAQRFNIQYEENDMTEFYKHKGLPRTDLSVRPEFDGITVSKLARHRPDVVAYCGYMSIASPVLVNAFLGVNVHPADLRIRDENGRRKFVGAHSVRDAILAGEKQLRATTHLVSDEADQGAILMVSKAVKVQLPKNVNAENVEQVEAVARAHQERLKKKGDWKVFPATLKAIAQGRFSQDDNGRLFYDGKGIPRGVEVK